MEFRRTSAPLTIAQKLEIVSVADLREHNRIFNNYEDGLLEGYLEAAYDFLAGEDGWLGKCCLVPETFEAYFPTLRLSWELPMRPVADLATFQVMDASGAYSAGDATRYRLALTNPFRLLQSAGGPPYPTVIRTGTSTPDPWAYKVTFTAGFGTTSESVPSGIRHAILMLAGHLYQNREATFSDTRITSVSREVQFGLRNLAGLHRIEPDHS